MRIFLLGAVSAVALFAAGSAMAGGNASDIEQIGTANNASVDQTAETSNGSVTINQSDSYNSANATQGGSGNQATVTQSNGAFGAVTNPSNQSTTNQQGANGVVTVIQVGNSTSNVTQYGGSSNEHAIVGQSGNSDSATVGQSGAGELGVVNQEQGSSNSASISQSGVGSGPYTGHTSGVSGPGYLDWNEQVPADALVATTGGPLFGPYGAIVSQVGSNETGTINQSGTDNYASVAQDYTNTSYGNSASITQGGGQTQSLATSDQDGQYNVASTDQEGVGSSFSQTWQHGVSNQAYASQVGNAEVSTILQGFASAGSEGGAAAVSGDYANVSQSGGGDTSTVNQSGNNDWALVSQVGANATSTVSQGGSYNVATVHQ